MSNEDVPDGAKIRMPTFRRRLFGGLDPQEVREYIAELTVRHQYELSRLEQELHRARSRIDELDKECESRDQQLDSLREQLSAATAEAKRLAQMEDSIKLVLLRAQKEADSIRREAHADIEALAREKERLQQESLEAMARVREQGEMELSNLRARWQQYVRAVLQMTEDLHALAERAQQAEALFVQQAEDQISALTAASPTSATTMGLPGRPFPADVPAAAASRPGQPMRDTGVEDRASLAEPSETPLLMNHSSHSAVAQDAPPEEQKEALEAGPAGVAVPWPEGKVQDMVIDLVYPALTPASVAWWLQLQEEVQKLPGVASADVTLRTHQSGTLRVQSADTSTVLERLAQFPGLRVQVRGTG